MQKVKTIDDMEALPLLSRYDESSAKEIDELKAESDALEAKKAVLLEEIEKAKKQLALADKKSMLNEIYKEQERLELAISEIRQTLPRLQVRVESFSFDFDVSTLEERYQKVITEINDALAQKESYISKLLVLKEEIQSLSSMLKELQASVSSIDKDLGDFRQKAEILKARIEGLKSLKNSLSQKTDTLQNPYKDAIEALKTDIKGLSELCERLSSDYALLLGSAKGLLGSIKDKAQFSTDVQAQTDKLNALKSQTESLKAEIDRITASIDEVTKQTTSDKERATAIQAELDKVLSELQQYLDEIAKVKELTKSKDEAEQTFKRLYIENACLSEGLKIASKAHRKIKDTVRKML